MNKNGIPVIESIESCEIGTETDDYGREQTVCYVHGSVYVGPGADSPHDLVCAATSSGDLDDDH